MKPQHAADDEIRAAVGDAFDNARHGQRAAKTKHMLQVMQSRHHQHRTGVACKKNDDGGGDAGHRSPGWALRTQAHHGTTHSHRCTDDDGDGLNPKQHVKAQRLGEQRCRGRTQWHQHEVQAQHMHDGRQAGLFVVVGQWVGRCKKNRCGRPGETHGDGISGAQFFRRDVLLADHVVGGAELAQDGANGHRGSGQ